MAQRLADKGMHDDLAAVWRTAARFGPGIVYPATLKLGWLADRARDRVDSLRH